jgi:hypothetical protein
VESEIQTIVNDGTIPIAPIALAGERGACIMTERAIERVTLYEAETARTCESLRDTKQDSCRLIEHSCHHIWVR